MNAIQFIKPAHKGLIVRDPVSKNALSDKGENKPFVGKEGIYWRRRVKDGSVIITEKKSVKSEPVKSDRESSDKTAKNKYGGNK